MGDWSDEVHKHRKEVALARAREQLRAAKKGYTLKGAPDTSQLVFWGLVGAGSGVAWLRHNGLGALRNWKSLPVISSFVELFSSAPRAHRSSTKKRSKKHSSSSSSRRPHSAAADTALGGDGEVKRKKKKRSSSRTEGATGEEKERRKKSSGSSRRKEPRTEAA